MVKLVSRTAMGWSKYSPASNGYVRQGVALHYNGGPTGLRASASHSKCVSYWRGVASYHRSKWADIGYAWGVCPHGYTFEGRGFDQIQAAQPGGNATYQSITLMIGGNERPGAKHIAAVKETIAWLRSRGVANRIRGHRDFNSTSCPGNIIYSMMRQGAFNPGGSWSGEVGPSYKYWTVEGLGIKIPTGSPLLSKGDSGTAVKRMQKGLLEYDSGFLPEYGADADYGSETKRYVKRFQRQNGLSDDGVYGPNTAKALRRALEKGRDFLDMSEFITYSSDQAQTVSANQENYIRFNKTSREDSEPIVSFVFTNKKFAGVLNARVKGTPGAVFGLRMVQARKKDGEFIINYRGPDNHFTIPESGEARVSVPMADMTYSRQRARATIYPFGEDMTVDEVEVTVLEADR